MSRCYALTKDHKHCRCYGELLATDVGLDGVKEVYYSPTCRLHRGFFDNWLQALPRRARSLEWLSINREHIKRVLKEGIVEIPPSFFQSLSGTKYNHFILLCVKYLEGFRFSWNPLLCSRALRACSWQSRAAGPVTVQKTYPLEFLRCMDDVKEGVFMILEATPLTLSISDLLDLLYATLHSDSGLHALLDPSFPSEERIRQCKERFYLNTKLASMMESGEFIRYVSFLKEQFYATKAQKIHSFCDELLEVAWQPERVQDWCLPFDAIKIEDGQRLWRGVTNSIHIENAVC